jgi:hypothetical protein
MKNSIDATPDTEHLLKDAGLIAADAAAQVAAADKRVDLGLGRFDGRLIFDVTAIEVASGDELYRLKWQLSNSATFASGVIGQGQIDLGNLVASGRVGETDTDSVVGTYEIGVCNEVNGTLYRYGRVYTDVTGTIATGINYTARLVTKS